MDFRAQSDAFKLAYEKFIAGCDALEETGKWDKASLGDMEGYYFADIMGVILHLISADGKFTDQEAAFVDDAFGFRYTAAELAEIYRLQGDDIDRFFREDVPEGYKKMLAVSPILAESFMDLLLQACELAAASDGTVHVEQERIDTLKEALGKLGV